MQKLFENWREFKKKVLKEYISDTDLVHKAENPLSSMKVSDEERDLLLNQFRIILSYGIPPLAIPELKQAIGALNKNPSLSNTGNAALALLATIPFLGAPAKAVQAGKVVSQVNKVKTAKQIVNSAEKTSKAMKGAPQYQELASKIDDAVVKAKEEIEALVPWTIGQHSTLYVFGKYGEKLKNLNLLSKAAQKLGTIWKGPAWRGENFKSVKDLFERLGLPIDGAEYQRLYELNKGHLIDAEIADWARRSGKKVTGPTGRSEWMVMNIKPTLNPTKVGHSLSASGGSRVAKLSGEASEAGIQSFAKTREAAATFATGPGGKVQVLYKTKGGNKLIDIEATLDKGSDILQQANLRRPGGTSDLSGADLRKFLQNEQELLSAGPVKIEQVLIRFWY